MKYLNLEKLSNQLRIVTYSRITPIVIISVGIILRLRQYIFNRSLWFDEAILSLIVMGQSFKGLLEPYGPPIGFMMILKYLTVILGNSEYALRLFPLICGIASVVLFYFVANYLLSEKKSILFALILFVSCDALIYYSSEVKQYSSDVAVILALYLLARHLLSRKLNVLRIIVFGFSGAVAIWFSQPSLFLLAVIGLAAVYVSLKNKDYMNIMRLLTVSIFWVSSFIIYYLVSLNKLVNNPQLLRFWGFAFVPFPPRRITEIEWIIDNIFNVFKNPVGITLMDLAAFCYLVGCASFYKKRKEYVIILFMPLFFVFIASSMHKYPFFSRLLLFLVPSFILLISEGTFKIIKSLSQNSGFIKITLVILLVSNSLFAAAYSFVRPHTKEEIKPAIGHIKENWSRNDIIYLHHGSAPAFKYYAKKYGFSDEDYILGLYSINDYNKYEKELDSLIGYKRVWVVFSHVAVSSERAFIVTYLNGIGKQLDVFYGNKATVYLYDLSKRS